MKKICTKCSEEKLLDDFSNKQSSKDGKHSICKECTRKNNRLHYENNKQYYKDKSKKGKEELQKWYEDFKSKLVCSKCPESRWWVLDFHHRDPSKKEGNLRQVLFSKGKGKFLEEVNKCDVLCSNCHRDHHYQEKMLQ